MIARVTAFLHDAASILRRVVGAPDYEQYLAHVARMHPDRCPMTREEFLRSRLEDRYSRPGARCC